MREFIQTQNFLNFIESYYNSNDSFTQSLKLCLTQSYSALLKKQTEEIAQELYKFLNPKAIKMKDYLKKYKGRVKHTSHSNSLIDIKKIVRTNIILPNNKKTHKHSKPTNPKRQTFKHSHHRNCSDLDKNLVMADKELSLTINKVQKMSQVSVSNDRTTTCSTENKRVIRQKKIRHTKGTEHLVNSDKTSFRSPFSSRKVRHRKTKTSISAIERIRGLIKNNINIPNEQDNNKYNTPSGLKMKLSSKISISKGDEEVE